MSLRRQGRLHQTVATQQSETYWDYKPDQRVMTIDGPGRVIAVSDGPFPGAEEYEIRLEGGLGGGTYTPSQITAATSVEASTEHLASDDYPELGSILYDRPDPATIRHTAELGSGGDSGGDGGDGGSSPASSSAEVASGDADESHVGWDPGPYNDAMYHDWRIAAQDPGPNDIARHLDKFKDAQEEAHQDDARYAVNWEPLHNSSIPAAEHNGWMFMEHKGEQARAHNPFSSDRSTTTPPLTTYKHGITRENLNLDPRGVPWVHQGGGQYQISSYNADNHLRRRGHYDLLDKMGATPETAYNDDYKLERNKRLSDNGFNVVSAQTGDGKTYLRFGDWPEDERSDNNVTGGKEEGVSVYDLDHHGEPMDPDPHMNRGHHHDEDCEPHCDLDWDNDDFGNDTHEEMNGRVHRAEKGRRNDYDQPHQVGHLVKGEMVGIGHDGEPLLNNVKRVGDWIDHRHHFVRTAEPHHLARNPGDEGYEPHEGEHEQLKLFGSLPSPDDGGDRDWHENDPEEWAEDGFCHVGHPGPCRYDRSEDEPHNRHTAMPSRNYPEHPAGFTSDRERGSDQWETRLNGRVPDKRYSVARILHTAYDDNGGVIKHDDDPHKATALKVHMLEGGGVPGAASALMDHLYDTYPNAKINHGYRTSEGIDWWNSYDDPAPHRNVHNLQPHEWEHHFDRKDVGEDILKNEDKDPGHHTNEHDVDWAYEDDAKTREPEGHEQLHHGMSVHLPSTDHRIVHDLGLSTEERAHHLLNVIGRGNMPEFDWHTSGSNADRSAEKSRPEVKGDTFGQPHKTKVTLHGKIHGEDATRDFDYDENNKSFSFPSDNKGSRDFHLHGITWENTGPGYNRLNHHDFTTPQPVAIAPDDSARHTPMATGHDYAVREMNEHQERYAPKGLSPVPSHVDQGELFPEPARQKVHAHLTLGPSPEERNALKTHLLSHHGYTNDQLSMLDDPGQGDDLVMEHHMEHNADTSGNGISDEFGRGEIEDSKVDHDHKGNGGIADRFPQTTEFDFHGTPQGHYLSMLHVAAHDNSNFCGPACQAKHEQAVQWGQRQEEWGDGTHCVNCAGRIPQLTKSPIPSGSYDLTTPEEHAWGANVKNRQTDAWPVPNHTLSSLSALPGVEASTWIRPHDDDEEDLTDHLVNHHGQDRRFIGDAYDHHDRLHEEADDEDYMGPEPEGEPHEHHDMRDYHPQPWEGKNRAGGSSQEEEHRRFLAPGGGHDYKPVPRTIQSLNHLLVTAAMDTEFRFHITAAWRDVQAKAVRIRKAGGVQITHSSDAMVIANVQGDHHVYETGLQRVPGRRTAVAVYSCGCKWGAYHWGADDDMSRFAGRMCSHALALQYEAQARGMFGRDVTVDDTKPRWVPSKVVVKYDIDDGKNIQARSSLVVPEQAPLLAILALADENDPGLGMVWAAVNDMFGDNSGKTEPMSIDPIGPTEPWNKEENPTSAGSLAGGEPSNWGRINSPSMYPRLSSAGEAGAEATFHEEPEPALPSTDGDDHTASLGDVDLAGGSGIGGSENIGAMGDDELSPENPSMQTMGVQEIVAAFQRSAGAKHLMDSGKPGDTSNSDIAGAAEAYLQKTAASATEFSLAEREALINENPGVQASNTDRLDIAGTHYAEIDVQAMNEEDDYLWMA